MPNMHVWRTCDTVETAVAWRHAIERRDEFAKQHAAPVDLEVALRPFREAVTVQEALVAELSG